MRPSSRHPFSREELDHAFGEYPPLLTVREAAQLLRVSPSTIHHRIARGELRSASRGKKPTLLIRDRLVREYFRD